MSFTNLIYHVVFSTASRKHTIPTQYKKELYVIIHHIIRRESATTLRIGGMCDHVHILMEAPATVTLSKLVQSIKRESSRMLRDNSHFPDWDGWEEGYGGFSVGYKDVDAVINYIKGQKEHHSVRSFRDEYRQWLIENGISENEPFFPK